MKHASIALLSSLLCGALAVPLLAQGPGQAPAPPRTTTAPPAMRFGGPMIPAPLIGSATAVDPAAGTITVTPYYNGTAQVVRVGANTRVTSLVTVHASQLRAGERVEVNGIPTAITASSLLAGDPPRETGFGMPDQIYAGPGAGGGQGPAGSNQASIVGRVYRTNPLTLALGNDVYLTVKLTPDAKVARYENIGLDGIHPGDSVRVTGTRAADGSYTASSVDVNLSPAPNGGRPGGMGPSTLYPGARPLPGQYPGGPGRIYYGPAGR